MVASTALRTLKVILRPFAELRINSAEEPGFVFAQEKQMLPWRSA
jgi:hypothetical protein